MYSKYLKIATILLALVPAAFAGERAPVLIQGKAVSHQAHSMTWTLSENGRLSGLGSREAYQVPADRYLVITQAAFSIRGTSRAARAAHVRITMRTGGSTLDLAEATERLLNYLDTNTVTRTFTPGLVVPSGGEVWGSVKQLQPAVGTSAVDVTFYGYLVPNAQAW